MAERKPFIFGVGYLLREPEIEETLHQQFGSDEELVKHMKARGFEVNLRKPKVTIDSDTGVVVETVAINKTGWVGRLELIDEKDKSKLQKLIDEAAEIQCMKKLGDKEITGLLTE